MSIITSTIYFYLKKGNTVMKAEIDVFATFGAEVSRGMQGMDADQSRSLKLKIWLTTVW